MYCVSFINYNVNFPSNYLAVSNNCVTHTHTPHTPHTPHNAYLM